MEKEVNAKIEKIYEVSKPMENGYMLCLQYCTYHYTAKNRESQKGIVIGEGGSMLKKIGTAARQNLESFFDKKVRLNLWVKVKENWVARPEYLDMQGL